MDNILLIDAHNQLWRACVKFDFAKKSNSETVSEANEPDEVIFAFNFFLNLRPLIELFSPDKCFLVMEGHPQFRYDLYSEYKANRIIKNASKQEKSETFFKMREIVLNIIKHMPITVARAADYEADDVIATLSHNMQDENITVLSGDSDYIQLLQRGYKNIKIYNPIKKESMKAPDYHYVAWKCLNGDKSDNIPALLKPKKALEAISDPQKLEKFLEIEENRSNFSINRQLIEFRNVPEEDIVMVDGIKNFDLVKEEFAKLKFNKIINDTSWKKYVQTFECLKY